MNIKLYPHIGKQNVGETSFDVDMGQSIVHLDGKMVGIYCGRKDEPGRHLSFTTFLPEVAQQAIAAEVAKITGSVGKVTTIPPDEHEVIDDGE